ncbi:MAG: hypothetical protein A2Y14_04525 [Verrucomicrobia bacterium GWF2_51_19]|nr:MAG: hypothetical protein A2Y14_04525 [Verrucomicrobia bacterium GWF2_51_19]HCJ12512.1 hypothetical protein [Opitutae bacterium]
MNRDTIIGGLCLAAAFGLWIYQSQHQEEVPAKVVVKHVESIPGTPVAAPTLLQKKVEAPVIQATVVDKAELYVLENDAIRVTFTNRGGGIQSVAFKKYADRKDTTDPYVFNARNDVPALSLSLSDAGKEVDFSPLYKLVKQSSDSILFEYISPEGLKLLRGYKLSALNAEKESEPYLIDHETRFINHTPSAQSLSRVYLNLGWFPATPGDNYGEYLNFTYYNGKTDKIVKIKDFKASNGFFGIGRSPGKDREEQSVPNLEWGSVKNQFFATLMTPNVASTGFFARPKWIGADEGITASLSFDLGELTTEKILGLQFYVGPKEYTRLDMLGKKQDLIMQFGFFGFISRILVVIMNAIHGVLNNWGWTIIVLTLFVKLLLWPLTAAQVNSSKRMALIQKPLQTLREKYKGNPQKLQTETMKLFKENKVNPAAGCLPLLIQLPIFLGFYYMLRSTAEFRFAPFLWISDLSIPDTLFHVAGFPFNPLPLVMGVTMFLQMQMTPSPTMDSTQKRIFQFMPAFFLFICYNFPSGLVLYWTVQNLLTILQQLLTNRKKA